MSNKQGARNWYIVDGYMPYKGKIDEAGFEGHEAVMILNCQDADAEVVMDIYYEDKEPDQNIPIAVPARRVKCLRMDDPNDTGGIVLDRQKQYSLRFRSDIEVIIQYGRMDIAQPNLAYIGMMGYSE
ncbi:sensory rhodopsin transducer [Paenibacillus mesophilus]|uniref:sensory rhodopsin transducer n=1 Tax=Paenibacillus mesophilus TaxID=2582849 RepID=UPI00130525A9|nr:sensory rhodopsin transducer [Paenibacillus mesophilus]